MALAALLTISCLLQARSATAATFESSFLSFELPDQWACKLEGAEWVCDDQKIAGKQSSIIILTAKLRGPDDRLEAYVDHLSAPKTVTDAAGNDIGRASQVIFVRREMINGREWVHARHFGSELPRYTTEYFATVDGQVAILITFSAFGKTFQSAYDKFYPSMASIAVRQNYR